MLTLHERVLTAIIAFVNVFIKFFLIIGNWLSAFNRQAENGSFLTEYGPDLACFYIESFYIRSPTSCE